MDVCEDGEIEPVSPIGGELSAGSTACEVGPWLDKIGSPETPPRAEAGRF